MFKFIRLALLSIGCIICSSILYATEPLPTNLLALNSPSGQRLALQSPNTAKLFLLLSNFVTQKNQTFCGVASSVIVLNALAIPALVDPIYQPYAYFTQEDFFTPDVLQIITPEEVAKNGLTLATLGKVLSTFHVTVTILHGADMTLTQFRHTLVTALRNPQSMIIVNFLPHKLGEPGDSQVGHFSPIAAYNKQTDKLLVLDVSRYKNPPFWVDTKDLWRAVRTIDSDSRETRGLLIVRK